MLFAAARALGGRRRARGRARAAVELAVAVARRGRGRRDRRRRQPPALAVVRARRACVEAAEGPRPHRAHRRVRVVRESLRSSRRSRPRARKFSASPSPAPSKASTSSSRSTSRAPCARPTSRPQDRLFVAKRVIRDQVLSRPRDRVGLVVFAGEAFTQSAAHARQRARAAILDAVKHRRDHRRHGDRRRPRDRAQSLEGQQGEDARGHPAHRRRQQRGHARARDRDGSRGRSRHQSFPILVGKGGKVPFPDGTDIFGAPRYVTVDMPVNPALLEVDRDPHGHHVLQRDRRGHAQDELRAHPRRPRSRRCSKAQARPPAQLPLSALLLLARGPPPAAGIGDVARPRVDGAVMRSRRRLLPVSARGRAACCSRCGRATSASARPGSRLLVDSGLLSSLALGVSDARRAWRRGLASARSRSSSSRPRGRRPAARPSSCRSAGSTCSS